MNNTNGANSFKGKVIRIESNKANEAKKRKQFLKQIRSMTCLTYHEFLSSFMPVKLMLLDRLSFLPIVQNLILLWLSSSRNGFRCSG